MNRGMSRFTTPRGRTLLACAAVALILAATVTIIPWLAWFPRTEPICYPPLFPSGETLELDSFEMKPLNTTSPFFSVHEFYVETLDAQPVSFSLLENSRKGESIWIEEKVAENNALFSCKNALNGYEIEWGCIHIMKSGEGSALFLTWYLTPTDAPACIYQLDIPQVR